MAETASSSRGREYTEVMKCRSCGRAMWLKRRWNGATVTCPKCGASH